MSGRERSESLGPSLRYLRRDFLAQAIEMAQLTHDHPERFEPVRGPFDPADPNFYQFKEAMAYSNASKGHGLSCPRDGLPNCSLVDALDMEDLAGQVTLFQSWLWSYPVRMMNQVWNDLDEPEDATFIWICFCCNNVRAAPLTASLSVAPDYCCAAISHTHYWR